MEIIFLGLMYCDEFLGEAMKLSYGNLQIAPHTFQNNLFNGFKEIDNVDFSIINVPPMGSYPINNRKLFLKAYKWGSKNTQIGYLNLPFIKHAIQKNKIINILKKRIKNNGENFAIVIYSLYEPFIDAANYIKDRYQNVKLVLIQTDAVPGRGDMDKYMTSSAIRKGNRLVKKIVNFDGFVVLTKYLRTPLEIGDRPYSIMECVCNTEQDEEPQIDNKNIFLYTGGLAKEYGLFELAEAFKIIKNAELWVCGNGEMSDYFIEAAKENDNISYFGCVTPDEVKKIRRQANFLVNPRRPSGTYTRYSFPSKTAEYMMSGKPTIMYKLEGVPDEYDAYLNYLKSETPEKIAKEICDILNEDYAILCTKASQGRAFLLNRTSPVRRAKQIVELLEDIK